MKVRLFSLTSGLHAEAMSATAQDPFIQGVLTALGALDPSFAAEICGTPDAAFGTGMDLLYVRTGGTEGAFKAAFTASDGSLRLPDAPVLLLTSGKSNSLAASMEILSFLRLQGHAGEILHGGADYIAGRIVALAASPAAGGVPVGHKTGENVADGNDVGLGRRPFDAAAWKSRLAGKRLGLVGRPSDWLISSDVDPDVARERLGLELVDIPMGELLDEIRIGDYELPEGVNWPIPSSPARSGISGAPITRPFQPRFGRTLTPEAFDGAMTIYGALCRLVVRYRLDGLTLRCFDLLTAVGNTGCMALALLNARGIPSSCEGDVPALISMLVAKALTGCCGFQANPSRIDPARGEMLLAHCTVPLNMIRCGEYDTHFESGIGVAVRGELPEGAVTILKVSPDLRQCFAADATLLRNTAERDLCRTQVVLRAPGTARYFLTDSIGNHHIILPGHYASAF